MSEPCPFCGFKKSDFRKSHNWRCNRCGKDYANWLMVQKANAGSCESVEEENPVKEEPLFSRRKIPLEAKPVKFAESLFVLAMLLLLGLNFVVEGMFSWVYPISIPLAGYYAFTVHRTGYALGQHAVYSRDKNPIIHKAYLLGAVGYIFVALGAWIY